MRKRLERIGRIGDSVRGAETAMSSLGQPARETQDRTSMLVKLVPADEERSAEVSSSIEGISRSSNRVSAAVADTGGSLAELSTASSTIAAEVEGSAGMNEGSGAAAPQLADIARALDGPSERLDHSSAASSI